MRIGCWLPLADVDKTVSDGTSLESHGFDSVFIGDHLVFMNPSVVCPETWTLLTAIGARTKRVLLGSAVIDPIRRHPAMIAQEVATLDQLTRGRAILGIGVGEAMNLVPYGIDAKPSQQRLRESVEYVRALWSSSPEERRSYRGKFFSMQDAFITIRPYGKERVPIYLGGLTPKGRELAGEIGDGWFPWFSSTKTYADCVGEVRRGAEKSGKSPDSFEMVSVFYVAIDEDESAARAVLDRACRSPLLLEGDTLRRMGHDIPYDRITTMTVGPKGGDDSALHRVPRDAVESISASSKEECMRKVERFRAAGSTRVVIRNMGPDKAKVLDAFSREIIPYFRE